MDQDIANYNFAVHNSELAMVQDYYKNQPPFKDGKTVLAIITPWVASNGPGKKYTLTER